jgi:hypothetical protein
MNRSSILALLLAVAPSACGAASPTQPKPVDLDSEFTLAPDERAATRDDAIQVRFVEVTEDSRCPKDVQCVWAGEVKVRLTVRRGAGAEEEQTLTEREELALDTRRLTLVRVDPYPVSTQKIAKKDYRATFKVTAPRAAK